MGPTHRMDAAEAAVELERVLAALAHAHLLVAGVDQALGALRLGTPLAEERESTPHSGLRTSIEHSQNAVERVITYLRDAVTPADRPTVGIDQ